MIYKHASVKETNDNLKDEGVLLDIRRELDFKHAHPENAQHVNNANIQNILDSLEFSTPIYVICYSGISSQGLAQQLVEMGFQSVFNVSGGFSAWQKENLPFFQG